MPNPEDKMKLAFDRPGNYRIRVECILDDSWNGRLGDLRIEESSRGDQGPNTTLVGRMRDQAELVGVLNTLYELHLPLLSVERIEDGPCVRPA
jgi:hypothetical protein